MSPAPGAEAGGAAAPGERARRLLLAGGALLFLVPMLRTAAALPAALGGDASIGDLAIIELGTIEAAAGHRLLGQVTRFGFHQPGPAMFYLLAPFHAASGGERWALSLATLVLGWGLLLAGAYALTRWSEPYLGLIAVSPVLILFLDYVDAMPLFNYWNAHLIILPAALLPLVAARAALGSAAAWPALVALASWLAQTYSSPTPAAGAVLGLALALFVVRRRSAASTRRRALAAAVASVLVATLAWGPVLYEEMTREPGNLKLMARSMLAPGPRQLPAPAAALDAVARELASPWLVRSAGATYYQPLAAGHRGMARAAAALWAGLLLGAAVVACRRRQAHAATVCVFALVMAGATFLAALRLEGGLHPHAFMWLGAPAAVGWGLAAAVLLDPLVERAAAHRTLAWLRRREIAFAAVAVSLAVWLSLRPLAAPRLGDATLDSLAGRVLEHAAARGCGELPVHLVSHGLDQWWVSGLLVRLWARGAPAALVNLAAAGPYWEARGRGCELHFSISETPPAGLERLSCHAVQPLAPDTGTLCVFAPAAP